MISFFPDLNVWLALSTRDHRHSPEAWSWLRSLPQGTRMIFARYTQVGLLRLLTNHSVMGEQTLTLHKAWAVYDRWMRDPRVEFYPEPRGIEDGFRVATAPFGAQAASKLVGDCYLLAFAQESQSALVTFDKALIDLARKQDHPVVVPA